MIAVADYFIQCVDSQICVLKQFGHATKKMKLLLFVALICICLEQVSLLNEEDGLYQEQMEKLYIQQRQQQEQQQRQQEQAGTLQNLLLINSFG